MNRMRIFVTNALIITGICVSVSAQETASTTCAELAQGKALEINGDQNAIADVARCFIQHQNNLDGARWFEKIADDQSCKPEYLFEYAQCLKALNLYGKAKFYFQKYAQYDPVVGNQFMQSCDVAKLLQEGDKLFDVTPVIGNTAGTESSPSVHSGQLSFTQISSHTTYLRTRSLSDTPSTTTGDLFKGGTSYRWSQDGRTVVYSSQTFDESERLLATGKGSEIFIIQKQGDSWGTPVQLPFGDATYNVAYPYLSADGSRIYFASDMPGGQGGWDIYTSRKNGDSWTLPENLGPNINTQGNEISPSINGKDLYFSSDWHTGLGGFDVFVTTESMYGFGDVRPVGYPVNSTKDDIDYVWDPVTQAAYFSSNRVGGIGSYDLYKAVPKYVECVIRIKHKETMKPLENAMVVLSPGISRAMYSDDMGTAVIRYAPGAAREVRIQLDGYTEYRAQLGDKVTPGGSELNIYMEPAPQKTIATSQPAPSKPEPVTKPVEKAPVIAQQTQPVEAPKPAPVVTQPKAVTVSSAPVEERYFIQIAALARNSDLTPYSDLRQYGDLVVHDDAMYSRVRVGTFVTENDARTALARVKAGGYPDAFVVKHAVETHASPSSLPSEYKVRVATYSKASNFDPSPLEHLGKIESYRKDEFTIMLLAGYSTLSAAQRAREAAVVQGFKDAYVVMDNNGVLEKVRD